LITFITSSHICLCKSKILASKRSKTLNELKNYILVSMSIINVIVVVKVYNNNQWPSNRFNINVKTTYFKVDVSTSAIAHIWALGTLYML
jgi:high-affinity K+ transport system ATPase subunit B